MCIVCKGLVEPAPPVDGMTVRSGPVCGCSSYSGVVFVS